MTVGTKHHRPDDVKRTTASQGSRSDAQPPSLSGREFASFSEEFDYLITRKRELEAKLSADYSTSAMNKRQAEIRRRFNGDSNRSFSAWVDERARLDKERAAVIADKAAVENRMTTIKSRVMEERRQDFSNASQPSPIKFEQLDELKRIRLLLETLVDHFCGDRK